ncbi:hypothetical protein SGPA1_50221 [Streptomyces misionensis JCM 4497]
MDRVAVEPGARRVRHPAPGGRGPRPGHPGGRRQHPRHSARAAPAGSGRRLRRGQRHQAAHRARGCPPGVRGRARRRGDGRRTALAQDRRGDPRAHGVLARAPVHRHAPVARRPAERHRAHRRRGPAAAAGGVGPALPGAARRPRAQDRLPADAPLRLCGVVHAAHARACRALPRRPAPGGGRDELRRGAFHGRASCPLGRGRDPGGVHPDVDRRRGPRGPGGGHPARPGRVGGLTRRPLEKGRRSEPPPSWLGPSAVPLAKNRATKAS